MSLHVAVVAEHPWHRVPGGTATAVDATLEALTPVAPDITFTGLAARHRTPRPTPIPTTHSRLPRPLLYEGWHRLARPRSGRGADVIWAPAMAVPPRTAPLVVTVHDVDFLDHPDRLSRRGRSFFPRAWQAALERADRIVVPSEVVRSAAEQHGASSDRLVVVPWGVDAEMVEPEQAAEVRRRLALPERFVLWVGTAEPRKNLPRLVAAMRGIDAPLVIAGPAGWVVDLDETLAPLGDRVIRLGRLDRADLDAVYALATVFAFPSLDEGFGLPVLEAMAQGTPVVTSAGTATEEVAGGAAVLVDPAETDTIAAAIASLLDDDARRSERTEAGRRRAEACSWSATATAYATEFRRLAGAAR